ncbi:hypothetical protein E2C01_097091 [Portunus trituberculatus]|uniref:Uncharacterized protein n=1 Tax=Portunus trituberculatus TaxID=210409 RepID=A0A5B7K4T4_PORTR|nr:hypothetical protein [Portunus trituberculatus]
MSDVIKATLSYPAPPPNPQMGGGGARKYLKQRIGVAAVVTPPLVTCSLHVTQWHPAHLPAAR